MKLFRRLFLLIVFLSLPNMALAANHYISQGATGNNSGSDWANAWVSMPATFVRGDTYYVADGTYPGFTVEVPPAGNLYITIKKAILSDHGTDAGWLPSYGDGVAHFTGAVYIYSSYVKLDGQVGGGPGSWKSGYGFEVTNTFPSTNGGRLVMLNKSGGGVPYITDITISHVNAYPNNIGGNGQGFGGGIFGYNTRNVVVDHCWFHDMYGTPFFIISWQNFLLQYTRLERNFSDPAGHSEGVSARGDCSNSVIRYNQFVDVHGTGQIVFLEAGQSDNMEIYGNLFYHTPSDTRTSSMGFVVGLNDKAAGLSGGSNAEVLNNFKIYNNTIYQVKGYYTGIDIQAGTGNVAYNNLIYPGNTGSAVTFRNVTHDYNSFGDGSLHGEPNGQTVTSSPFAAPSSEDFKLTAPTRAGYTLAPPYNQDMLGVLRGADGVWDRGALEYNPNAKAHTPNPPTRLIAN